MEVFLIAFVGMLLLVAAMAVGVIFSNKPITGSCGGMSALGMEVACDVCKGDKSRCEKEVEKAKKAGNDDLSYDAMSSFKN